ncbi:uncharacterized protein LOC115894568 [Rhinopithecus roxellana]|uniref:uncharacterized protein LOC115894568 n=1 Tax=Rhinopithecus roxellana TaxID=61622 RepID=UPI00123778DD|nr:uncharacterized protein LOC115894568 [Rhinopithecus roxellana]
MGAEDWRNSAPGFISRAPGPRPSRPAPRARLRTRQPRPARPRHGRAPMGARRGGGCQPRGGGRVPTRPWWAGQLSLRAPGASTCGSRSGRAGCTSARLLSGSAGVWPLLRQSEPAAPQHPMVLCRSHSAPARTSAAGPAVPTPSRRAPGSSRGARDQLSFSKIKDLENKNGGRCPWPLNPFYRSFSNVSC